MNTIQQKIDNYGRAYEKLVNTLEGIPREVWKYKPSQKEWSIHEVIIHLADIEANAVVRCLKGIAEPGGTIMPLDQDLWAERLYYHQQDADAALEVFRWLRIKHFQLLLMLPESTWQNAFNHPEGGLITLEQWLDNYSKHGDVHIAQIKRVYEQWKSRKAEFVS